MTRIRRLVALALATFLAAGFVVLGTGLPASANDVSVTVNGSRVTVTASGGLLESRLVVYTPAGNENVLASNHGGNRPLTGSFTAETNGNYTAKVQQQIVVWGDLGSRTFTVRAQPAAPGGLSATASGKRINVSWNQGTESDLAGYTVAVAGAQPKSGLVNSFCSGSTCSYNVTTSATGSVNVTVTARRSDGTSASSSTRVMVGGGPGGGGSGGVAPPVPGAANPGGNLAGGTTLPPANGNSPVNLPTVAPEGSNPNFAYPTPPRVAQSPISPKARSMAPVNSALQWGRSVALALIFLVCAAHLGTWTRRLRLAQGAASGSRASRLGRARVSVAQARIAQAEAVAKASALTMEAGLAEGAADASDPADPNAADLNDPADAPSAADPLDPADPADAPGAADAPNVAYPRNPADLLDLLHPVDALDAAGAAEAADAKARKGLRRRSRGPRLTSPRRSMPSTRPGPPS